MRRRDVYKRQSHVLKILTEVIYFLHTIAFYREIQVAVPDILRRLLQLLSLIHI